MRLPWKRRPLPPEPPGNVRLELTYGCRCTIVPVDSIYVGERDGMHVWETVTDVDLTGADTVRLCIARLPAKTSMLVNARGTQEEGGTFPTLLPPDVEEMG